VAKINKPIIVVAAVVITGAVVALAAPAFGNKTPRPEVQIAFGIKSTESVHGYQRQAGWRELAGNRFAVAPPRPDAEFSQYAIQSDPETRKVCAVYASTESEPALTRLRASLAQTYGEPSLTPSNGWRWSKGADYVEVEDVDGLYQVIWDFTGTCYEQNKAPGMATASPGQYAE